ncbi:MAG: LUD domain-containing protein [Pseudomonadota bacterium]
MTGSRDQILSAIRKSTVFSKGKMGEPLFLRTDKEGLLKRWQTFEANRAKHVKALVETFKRECEHVSGNVTITRSDDEVCQLLSTIVKAAGAKQVIRWQTPLLKRVGVDSLFDSLSVRVKSPGQFFPLKMEGLGGKDILSTDDDLEDQGALVHFPMKASDAEIGITGADWGLADTGTLVLRALPSQERSTSLLPPIHVAILESGRILAGLDDLIVRLMMDLEENKSLDSCLTMITGPSRTADIETELVLGIHGPRELHVILLDPY